MANLERSTAAAPARNSDATADIQELPTLFGQLSDGVMTLLDTKLSLLKIEIKEDADAYIRGGTTIGIGGIVAGVGFALLNVAVAFLVAKLFTFADPRLNYALGFLITGAAYLLIGGIVIVTAKNRLARRNLVPSRSVEEFKRDKEWIQKG